MVTLARDAEPLEVLHEESPESLAPLHGSEEAGLSTALRAQEARAALRTSPGTLPVMRTGSLPALGGGQGGGEGFKKMRLLGANRRCNLAWDLD